MNAPDTHSEPFGQKGVLPFVWPTFVVLCMVGLCTCVLMNWRSWTTWDIVSNTSANRQVSVASVIGRIVVDIYPGGLGADATASSWDFDSRTFETIQDAWPETWKKTLGIEWGDQSARRFGGQQFGFWRLRVRWRTLTLLYALPIAIELVRQIRSWRARAKARALVSAAV